MYDIDIEDIVVDKENSDWQSFAPNSFKKNRDIEMKNKEEALLQAA